MDFLFNYSGYQGEEGKKGEGEAVLPGAARSYTVSKCYSFPSQLLRRVVAGNRSRAGGGMGAQIVPPDRRGGGGGG